MTKLVAYLLQNVAINPRVCWLSMIFLPTDMFSSLSVSALSEWVDSVHTVVKIHRRFSVFKPPAHGQNLFHFSFKPLGTY